jgi:hypothetical protein
MCEYEVSLFIKFNMARKVGNFSDFAKKIQGPLVLRWFMFWNLPAALFSGVRLMALNEEECYVTLKSRWFNKNPFGSMYFACLCMAAEFSTGVLALGYSGCQILPINMIVAHVDAKFDKRAKGKITFICKAGKQINTAMENAAKHGKPIFYEAFCYAVNQAGEQVANFTITWQFKAIVK